MHVESNPLIWDVKNKDYHKSDKRDQIFQDFSNEYYPNSSEINSISVAAAWKSLHQPFKNILKNRKEKEVTYSGEYD